MEEIEKKLEGEEQTDISEGTSTSGEGGVELNNSPTPTPEEVHDADSLNVDNGTSAAGEPDDVTHSVVSDSPTPTDNVESSEPAIEEAPAQEDVAEQPAAPEAPAVPEEAKFTQSQVNDLVGRTRMETREQTYRAVYGRYGVEDEAGMDELVGNAQRYETIRGEYDEAKKSWKQADDARNSELSDIKEHVALLESGIDKARFDDAKAIIKSKGLPVTVESIQNELATHPEWIGSKDKEQNPNFRPDPNGQPLNTPPAPESTISVLGNEGSKETSGMTEEDYALKKLFKL